MLIANFLLLLTVVYLIRVICYLVCLYLETEKTIKGSNKFEHISSTNSQDVLFIGDSLTYGVGASIPEKSIAGLFHDDNPNCNVYNKSDSKITTRELLKQIERFENTKPMYQYSVVSIGANDGIRFRSMRGFNDRIRSIVKALESISESVYIFTPTKPGKCPLLIKLLIYYRLKKLRRIVQSLESKNVHHVDMWEVGDKLLANPKKYFAMDALHLSDAGQLVWYRQLKESMKK